MTKYDPSDSSCILRGRRLAHATEANGIACQASVGEAWVLADPVGRSQGVGGGFPRTAAEDVFLAIVRSARVLRRAGAVIARVVDILAPLGHIAVHVEETPRIGLLPPDGMSLLGGVVGEPGEVAELPRFAAE